MLQIIKPIPNPYYVKGYGLDPEVITYMRAYISARVKAVGLHPHLANEAALRAFEADHADSAEDFRTRIVLKHTEEAEKA